MMVQSYNAERYNVEYFRGRRLGEAFDNPFDTAARALKGYRRGARLLGNLRGKRLLDLGCGLGAGSWLMAKQGAHVTGIDVSEEAIRWARQTYEPEAAHVGAHLGFWTADLSRVGSGLGEFDALAVVDVLEHFPPNEAEELLARWNLMLRPGGHMFLHVPITANPLDWLLVVKNGLLKDRIQGRVLDHHGDTTHAARYGVHTLAHTLRRAGWQTRKLEVRAYSPRLHALERAAKSGRWGAAAYIEELLATDWDGIHR